MVLPAVGNTEVLTSGSSIFTAATGYTYKGYLGTATPIITGNGVDFSRTLQARLDETVSVKAFGAVGDASTDDTAAIQRALDELYTDTDKADVRSRRRLFFPAGQYNVSSTITVPPYANIIGEGVDGTIIYYSGAAAPVAVTQDNAGQ
jgi:polygalacturonase